MIFHLFVYLRKQRASKMKKLLKILQFNAVEILPTAHLKSIKGGEVIEDPDDMVEVE